MFEYEVSRNLSTGSLDFVKPFIHFGINIQKNKEKPKKYIINENATVLFWEDGTKTISKRHKEDKFDKWMGYLHASWQYYNRDKSKSLRKKLLGCIKPEKMKKFLFERFRAENNMTVEQARKYLDSLKVESNKSKAIRKEKLVKVVDEMQTYSFYEDFIEKYFPQYFEKFKKGKLPIENKIYKLIGQAPHDEYKRNICYLIQDMTTEQVFIINEQGIEEVK